MNAHRNTCLLVLLALVGCDDAAEGGAADAAVAVDGEAEGDAGPEPDAGPDPDGMLPDSGPPDTGPPDPDAEIEADAETDAGIEPDGAIEPDAAIEPDGAIEPDAAPGIDCALCAEQGRACEEGDAACGECLDGWNEAGDPEGACVAAPGDPCDVAADCAEGLDCVQLEAPGAGVVAPQGTCAAMLCPDGQVWDSDAMGCAALNAGLISRCTDEEGVDGVWPVTDFDGNPVCRTLDGYFFDTTPGERRAKPCDADGDGWVRRTADGELGSDDLARSINARCTLHVVRGFVLENEHGQLREESLPDGVDTLALYEPDALDEDGDALVALQALPDGATPVPAAAINPLTKACISRRTDLNGNGAEDVSETPDAEAPADRAWLDRFTPFAYFIELHVGRFVEAEDGQSHGTWRIAERSRCDAGFALGYEAADDEWWRSCERRRPAGYAADAAGWDFARFGCDAEDGACPPVEARSGDPAEGSSTRAHGLCTAGLDADPVEWRGMNHFSQFRCVEITADPQSDWQAALADIWLGESGGPLQLNRCTFDEDGEVSCTSDTAETLTEEQRGGAIDGLAGTVAWTARRYADYDDAADYAGGCVNEWVEHPTLCEDGGDDAFGDHTGPFGRVVCDCRDAGFDAPPADNQVGACEGSVKLCDGGVLVEPEPGPTDFCDDIDDDCDGEVEESTLEVCDFADNDCDDETDEVSGVGFACAPAGAATIGAGPGMVGDEASIIEAERDVVLSRDFAFANREVTKAWADLLGYVPYEATCEEADCPVRMTFADAALFANVMSAFDGYDPCYLFDENADGTSVLWPQGAACSGYRLPTSAEWEYAARADGEWDPIDGAAACGADAEVLATCGADVNPWGICDTVGNLDEWAWDVYALPDDEDLVTDGDAVTIAASTDPAGPDGLVRAYQPEGDDGDRREIRGGAAGADACDLGGRRGGNFDAATHGVRLVRTARPQLDVTSGHTNINDPFDLDPYFDDLGRIEVDTSAPRAGFRYFRFTLPVSAPVRIEQISHTGEWTERLEADVGVDGDFTNGRSGATCPYNASLVLYRQSGDSWDPFASDSTDGQGNCALIWEYDINADGDGEQLPAGEYIVSVRPRGVNPGNTRLVLRRRLANAGAPCRGGWITPDDPAQPYFPACNAGSVCLDAQDPFRTGVEAYDTDGLGFCVAASRTAISNGGDAGVRIETPGQGHLFEFIANAERPIGYVVRSARFGQCDDVPALRLRLYREDDGMLTLLQDVSNEAGECPSGEAEIQEGTHYVLVEAVDPDLTIPGTMRFSVSPNVPE